MELSSTLFRFRQGDHVCVFYQDENALLNVLAGYLAEGLARGERCFCAQRQATMAGLELALQRRGIDPAHEKARGALELHLADDLYRGNGGFEPKAMMEMLERSIEEAVRKGFSGLRTAGEMGWAAQRLQDCDRLVAYEQMVEKGFQGKRAIGMCQYPVGRFDAQVLGRILAAHRLALQETTGGQHASLTMRIGEYAADVVPDRLRPDTAYYYVVQRVGEREIAGWGEERTFEDARWRAEQLALELGRDRRRREAAN